MSTILQIRRGSKNVLDTLMMNPLTRLYRGEQYWTTDTHEMYVSDGTRAFLVSDILIGTFNDIPNPGVERRMFFVKDGTYAGSLYIDDGQEWIPIFRSDSTNNLSQDYTNIFQKLGHNDAVVNFIKALDFRVDARDTTYEYYNGNVTRVLECYNDNTVLREIRYEYDNNSDLTKTLDIVNDVTVTIQFIYNDAGNVQNMIRSVDGTWVGEDYQLYGPGFLDLRDTPHSYIGQRNKVVVVNSTETGLTFRDVTFSGSGGGGGVPTFNYVDATSDYSASNFDYIFLNSVDGTFTVYLPPNPELGWEVTFINAANSLVDNPVTVNGNGKRIMQSTDPLYVNSNSSFKLIQYNDVYGWRILSAY